MKMAIRWREELESSVQRVHVCVCFTSKLLCKLLLRYLIMPSGLIVPSIAVDVTSGFSVLGLFCVFFFSYLSGAEPVQKEKSSLSS